jgi:4'-phosphopantetheinyl transferase
VPATSQPEWLRPSRPPLRLDPGEVHVWRLAHNPQCLPPIAWESTLSADEHARANRFAFHRDRNAYVTTRAALRELLGQYLSTPPAEIQFHYADRGKPTLLQRAQAPTAGDPPVHFNVSHTRSLALLAFSSDRRLGIDVEQIRPIDNWEDIARRFFSQTELAELRALPPDQRDEGFYTCWTRKESYIKARGEGLHLPLDSFDVTLTPGVPERLTAEDASNWTLVSLYPHQGYAAALTAEGQNLNLELFDYDYNSAQATAPTPPPTQ